MSLSAIEGGKHWQEFDFTLSDCTSLQTLHTNDAGVIVDVVARGSISLQASSLTTEESGCSYWKC